MTIDPTAPPPDLAAIQDAASRLSGVAVTTPLLEAPLLNDRLGARVLVKAETLQRTGSFKFRGAYNRLSRIPPDERGRGVVAYSSGNHAQGVAAAARMMGIAATIVMPDDAPAIKIRNTKSWGATVVTYDRAGGESREAIGARIVEETGATLVRPYDDPAVIAGQGTVGLELAAQAAAMDARPDLVLVPCSGGGLAAGVSTAINALLPGARVMVVEPAGFDDTGRSLRAGARVANEGGATSICDALLAATPGELTFPINRRTLAGGVAVEDRTVRRAMALAFDSLKLVIEPGGAVGLAALLDGGLDIAGRTIAVVCSGGNVDPALFAEAVAAGA